MRRGRQARSSIFKTIQRELRSGMVQSIFDLTPRMFFPVDAIQNVFTLPSIIDQAPRDPKECVMKLLKIDSATDKEIKLVDFILTRAKITFLVCLYGVLPEAALHDAAVMFMKHGFDDDALPVDALGRGDLFDDTEHPFYKMELDDNLDEEWDPVWTDFRIDMFVENQWKFLAPKFSGSEVYRNLGQRVLPFVSKPPLAASHKSDRIQVYEVHHAHYVNSRDENDLQNRTFAVKSFANTKQGVADEWENEVRLLLTLNKIDHKHIVRYITSFQLDRGERYICFEWADGGNLEDLWNATPKPVLSGLLVRDVVNQVYGLAQGLKSIQYYKNEEEGSFDTYTHGDLKPANILWFRQDEGFGTLKIADFGGAKEHRGNTATRHNTTVWIGTRRYEPPELEVHHDGKRGGYTRSRLYDIWSFGCLTLEFIVWVLYGKYGLTQLHDDNIGDYGMSDSFYEINHKRVAKVHGVVKHWIEHMSNDSHCARGLSALGDLLDIVRYGLLVVKLPEGGGSIDTQVVTYSRFLKQASGINNSKHHDDTTQVPGSQSPLLSELAPSVTTHDSRRTKDFVPHTEVTQPPQPESGACPETEVIEPERFRAIELTNNLCRIAENADSQDYWYKDAPRDPIPPKFRLRPQELSSRIPHPLRENYAAPPIDPDSWKLVLDNEFAAKFFKKLAHSENLASTPYTTGTQFCEKCEEFRQEIWSLFFKINYETSWLSQHAERGNCSLCALLWKICRDCTSTGHSIVQLERYGSTLKMSGTRFPVISLIRNYDIYSPASDIQTGFSELPAVGESTHLAVIRSWLDHCDESHWAEPRCKRPSNSKKSTAGTVAKPPRRLIDVGSAGGGDLVTLRETDGHDDGDWIALSYRWGAKPHFETTRRNIVELYAGIRIDMFPQTFKDAIKVTRALNKRYLWIDSLCIIQGPDGDFEKEAKTMEDVYNGAYCVLAACCSTSQQSGFLLPRRARQCVTLEGLRKEHGAIHVCEMIDDFGKHVLQGDLHQRGWVLQEHALARRTIFFTDHQTYWECGHGIRCETMTTMENKHASLLGDPNFPKRLESAEHGEFSLRLQDLMKQYSRLNLTEESDRSTAILSLQKRLIRVMEVQGDYGLFDSSTNPGLFRRGLLWHRALDTASMKRITYPVGKEVPSWSWMAYSGPIDYFPLTFYAFDWVPLNAFWSSSSITSAKSETNNSTGAEIITSLNTEARAIDISLANDYEADLIFDVPHEVVQKDVKAVVLGIEKGSAAVEDRRHYALFVVQRRYWRHNIYERVGAGYIPGICLKGEPEPCSLV